MVGEFRELIRSRVGRDIPQDPREQLWMAIGAVFDSWHNDRAIAYRKINNIPGDWGTAVTVQSMVFGNLGDDCATGVAFTRDPAPAKRESTASTCRMRRARTWSRESAPGGRSV